MRLSRRQFEKLVAQAMEGLPDEFAEKLENVEFIVEDSTSPEESARYGLAPGTSLLGQYRGIPLTQRSPFDITTPPDRIIIFQRPHERLCSTRAEVVDEVRRTVLHEIAHHFGIPEQRISELGY